MNPDVAHVFWNIYVRLSYEMYLRTALKLLTKAPAFLAPGSQTGWVWPWGPLMGSVINPAIARPVGGPAGDLVQPVLQPPFTHTSPSLCLVGAPWDSGDRIQVGKGTRLRAAVGQVRAAMSEAPGAAHHGHELGVCIHGGTEPAVVVLELSQCDL